MREYAEHIRREIEALETALDGPSGTWDPDDVTNDDEQDAAYRAALDTLELAHDTDPADVLHIYMNETLLEVVTWRADEDRDRVQVEWLRTYGGPGCRIHFDGYSNNARVEAYSMDDRAEVSAYVPTLAASVYELAEACA
jgi:hypothetical protein